MLLFTITLTLDPTLQGMRFQGRSAVHYWTGAAVLRIDFLSLSRFPPTISYWVESSPRDACETPFLKSEYSFFPSVHHYKKVI